MVNIACFCHPMFRSFGLLAARDCKIYSSFSILNLWVYIRTWWRLFQNNVVPNVISKSHAKNHEIMKKKSSMLQINQADQFPNSLLSDSSIILTCLFVNYRVYCIVWGNYYCWRSGSDIHGRLRFFVCILWGWEVGPFKCQTCLYTWIQQLQFFICSGEHI